MSAFFSTVLVFLTLVAFLFGHLPPVANQVSIASEGLALLFAEATAHKSVEELRWQLPVSSHSFT